MLGPRARMRDAILLAELATLVGRLRQPDRFLSPILEMRFFDHELGPITRVATVDEGLAAIADIFATPRLGPSRSVAHRARIASRSRASSSPPRAR